MKMLIVVGLIAFAPTAHAQTAGTIHVQSIAADAACKNAKGAYLAPALRPPATPFDALPATLGRIKVKVDSKDCFLEAKDFSTGAASVACSQINSVQPFDVIGGTRGMTESAEPRCNKP